MTTPASSNFIASAAQRMAQAHFAKPSAVQPQLLSASDPLLALAERLKQRCARKALLGASASLIPLPLIDLAVDAVLLAKLMNEIHEAFGLSPKQIDALEVSKRQRTYAAIQLVGNRLIGTLVTRAVLASVIKTMGIKVGAQQLSKIVPVAGQIASASLNYISLKMLLNRHIDDCLRVAQTVSPQTVQATNLPVKKGF